MAEFLTTHKVVSNIETIIMDAESHLFLLSPYLQISNIFYERLKDASLRNINTKIVYRDNKLNGFEKEKLASLKKVSLYRSQNLHAKCYFNETRMVISSMNLFEYSEKNREMGVLVDRAADTDLYTKAAIEALSIIQFSALDILSTRKTSYDNGGPSLKKYINELGYCIRCSVRIGFNPAKPLCSDCYRTWVQFNNPDFLERACHKCGKNDIVSYSYPQCSECYYETRPLIKY